MKNYFKLNERFPITYNVKQGKCSVLFLFEGLISPMKQTIGVLGFHQEKRMKGVGLCKFQILLETS